MSQKRKDEWAEAKRRCRMSDEAVLMARELGMSPRTLIKNIPSPRQRWKAPVEEWIRPDGAGHGSLPAQPVSIRAMFRRASAECLVTGCGAQPFLQLFEKFTFDRFAPRGEHAIVLFDRSAPMPPATPGAQLTSDRERGDDASDERERRDPNPFKWGVSPTRRPS